MTIAEKNIAKLVMVRTGATSNRTVKKNTRVRTRRIRIHASEVMISKAYSCKVVIIGRSDSACVVINKRA